MLDYRKLYEPYSVDGSKLEEKLRYLQKQAVTKGIPLDIIDIAMLEIFEEVAKGKQYPLDKCPCGCGIDKAGTAITHAMESKMMEIDREIKAEQIKMLQGRFNSALDRQMQNGGYIKRPWYLKEINIFKSKK